MANILIIDDDRHMSAMLYEVVEDMGHTAKTAFTLQDGLMEAFATPYEVILLDVRLPDGSGEEKLPAFLSLPYSPEVIILTAYGSRDGAQFALESGAWDYISKAATISEIRLTIQRAVQYSEQKNPHIDILQNLNMDGLIWKSSAMAICIGHLAHAVKSDAGILITGETGTGKELFAQAIHNNSQRASKSFVIVDCAALPANLAESLLFGHEKGAFTGADKEVEGLIRQADGGTLFLDEIGELPESIQKSFLRVLQERRFRPLGAKREIESHFRVVAATNRNLDEMVLSGHFRQDLLHRIRSIVIHLPPLRKRPEDIMELLFHYSKALCNRYDLIPKSFSPTFLEMLTAYDWPGNVRELINCLEWAISASGHETSLYPKHLPTHIRMKNKNIEVDEDHGAFPSSWPTLKESRAAAVLEVEAQYLSRLMDFTQGNMKEACKISGLSLPQLYAQMKKNHLTRSAFEKS